MKGNCTRSRLVELAGTNRGVGSAACAQHTAAQADRPNNTETPNAGTHRKHACVADCLGTGSQVGAPGQGRCAMSGAGGIVGSQSRIRVLRTNRLCNH